MKSWGGALSGVSIESELGNNRKLPFHVQEGQVQFIIFILEDAKVKDLVCDVLCLFLGIAFLTPRRTTKPLEMEAVSSPSESTLHQLHF